MKMAPRHQGQSDDDKNFSSSDFDSDCAKNPRKRGSGSRRSVKMDKNTDEYKHRRERNNVAVKKSRTKSKLKTQQTLERVNTLREENAKLESKIQLLSKELSFLKDLFLAHAGSAHGQQLQDVDWNKVLATDEVKQECQNNTVNGEAIQNDHKYTIHANIKVRM